MDVLAAMRCVIVWEASWDVEEGLDTVAVAVAVLAGLLVPVLFVFVDSAKIFPIATFCLRDVFWYDFNDDGFLCVETRLRHPAPRALLSLLT